MKKRMKQNPNDGPIEEIAKEMANVVKKYGATTWQKWTCAHCGSRQGMEQPNVLFRQGECEECHKVTDITHCGFRMVMPFGAEAQQALNQIVRKPDQN